jgi:hypothetical protein
VGYRDGRWLAVADRNTPAIAVWERAGAAWQLRATLSSPSGPLDVRSKLYPGTDGTTLLTVDGDSGAVTEYTLPPADLVRVARRAVGRNMTRAEWKDFFPEEPYRRTFPDLPDGR